MSTANTSKEAWQKLALAFAKPPFPRVLQIRERLLKAQGSWSVLDYLNDVKTAANELNMIVQPVTDDAITLYILNSLSSEFESISAALRSKDNMFSFEELYEKLA